MNSISCIIPAFNEEKNMRATLKAVTAVPLLREIIVIDDGSTDGTASIVEEFPSVILNRQTNTGKSGAVAAGIAQSTGYHVMLLDADLKGINSEDIWRLAEPIIRGAADVTISIRGNTPSWMKRLGIDFMSGERVFPRKMVEGHLEEMRLLPGFSLEVYLNRLIAHHRYRVVSVLWSSIYNDFKWNKRGFWKGVKGELLMWRDIFSTVSPLRVIRDTFSLTKLIDTKKKRKFNKEYFSLWKEIPLFLSCFVRSLFYRDNVRSDRILIVVPCLIGEFVAALPAIFDFIQRHGSHIVDLVVTPQLKGLAERIIGIGSIYTTTSVYERWKGDTEPLSLPDYHQVIVLRMSPKAYELIRQVHTNRVVTYTIPILGYGAHLFFALIYGKDPERWRDFNFRLLGGVDTKMKVEEMIAFDGIKNHSFPNKKIIIHTSANWKNKMWNPDKWVELLKRLYMLDGFTFIFIGGKEDTDTYEYISECLPFQVHSLIEKTDLCETLHHMKHADYFIGIDSGPSNMAHFLGLPGITLVGVSPNMYRSPHSDHITIDKTGKNNLRAMFFAYDNPPIERITVEDVYEAFLKLHRVDSHAL